MNDLIEKLMLSLNTGFIDKSIISHDDLLPDILVNDQENNRKVLTTINRELLECDEFWISAAFLTMGGFASIVNTLIELESRNIKGKVLVSQYLNFTHPNALTELSKFSNLELKISDTDNFHSKGYVFKRGHLYNLIIGSSNLTAEALSVNKEWNLKVSAHRDSKIVDLFFKEFHSSYNKAIKVTDDYIDHYRHIYNQKALSEKIVNNAVLEKYQILFQPNKMQKIALKKIEHLRELGINKAILISATGTGKTLLSAFDVKTFSPKKFLFVVHRENIARKSMSEYKKVFGRELNCGVYIGSDRDTSSDFIFSTIQTISKDNHLEKFNRDHFDYIVIDETHRAGAESYKKIINYFTPKFLLGMTATPDRTDGFDIFTHFDHNIAYEIRLKEALSENMLCPFHYYGVTDIKVDGEVIDDKANFNMLTKDERVDNIIKKIKLYGTYDGVTRGLIFCSRKAEAHSLSLKFNERRFKTISLTGESSESDRIDAIYRLETDNNDERIDYIFTVDIFNEGIDIPKINQVIMLRPTQSSIIFVQQLGRGLRKVDGKEYLTVIDFIGNYNNNYLIPIALYGDKSYNKDTIRKLIVTGNEMIPGSSTVNFDRISRERIFNSIDNTNLQTKRELQRDYKLLKFKLGRVPQMIDFVNHNERDPYAFVSYSKSYFNFVEDFGDLSENSIDDSQKGLLEIFSEHINNSKRIEESLLINELFHNERIDIFSLKEKIYDTFGYKPDQKTIKSAIHNVNLKFNTLNQNNKMITYNEKFGQEILIYENDEIKLSNYFSNKLSNEIFRTYLIDSTEYSIGKFKRQFKADAYFDGFILYRKYSRRDVFRILCYEKEPVYLNVGGYFLSSDKSNCPIFVNYEKHEDISSTTKYKDKFLDNYTFQWMSKSNRTLNSPEIILMRNNDELRLPLFIKKSNDEGQDFYYIGDVKPIKDSFVQESMSNDKGGSVSVVELRFSLVNPVEKSLYNYITEND